MIDRRTFIATSLAAGTTQLFGCASMGGSGWVTLLDGPHMTNFDADWQG